MSLPHPLEALKDWHTVKPSSFAQYLLMCDVHDTREPDVFLDEQKAKEYGIGRTAYYFAFDDLQKNGWIELARKLDGKKRWRLLKGFAGESANADKTEADESANADFDAEKSENADNAPETASQKSANADESGEKNPQTRTEKSANADFPSNTPIRINALQKEGNSEVRDMSAFSEFEEKKPLLEKIAGKIGSKPKTRAVTFDEWLQIKTVFDFWKQHFSKNANTRLTEVRGRAVLDRLRSDPPFTVEEIREAVRGCRESPFHSGSNGESGGMVYDDLELICRSDQMTEKFRGIYEACKKGKKNNDGGKTDGSKHKSGGKNDGMSDDEWRRRNAHLIPADE